MASKSLITLGIIFFSYSNAGNGFPNSTATNPGQCCNQDRCSFACPGYVDCTGKVVVAPTGCSWPSGQGTSCPTAERPDALLFTPCVGGVIGLPTPTPDPSLTVSKSPFIPIGVALPTSGKPAVVPIATPDSTTAPLDSGNGNPGVDASSSPGPSMAPKSEIAPNSLRHFIGTDGTDYGSGTEFNIDSVTGLPTCPSGSMNVPDDLSLCINPIGVTYPHCAAIPPGVSLPPTIDQLTDSTQKTFLNVIDPGASARIGNFLSTALTNVGSLQETSAAALAPQPVSPPGGYFSSQQNMNGFSLVNYSNTQCAGIFMGSTLYPDTMDSIGTQTTLKNATYGPIFISSDPTKNPWVGTTTDKGAYCPNVNEKVSIHASSVLGVPVVLSQCIPAVTGSHSVLYRNGFESNFHNNEVLSSSFSPGSGNLYLGEPRYSGGGNKSGMVVESTLLQASPSNRSSLTPFSRGIWACEEGFKLNLNNGTCAWDSAANGCNAGNGASIPPSAAMPFPQGAPTSAILADLFDSKVNKKLACCSNDFTPNFNNMKLDCLETNPSSITDFDSLWQSVDDDGNLNALYLKNGVGNPMSGFYDLNGNRCNEFSEFTNVPIQPGIVNPSMTSTIQMKLANGNKAAKGVGAFEAAGIPITMPQGAMWNETVTRLGNLQPPQSADDRRRCPLLARAALVVECPKNDSNDPFAVKKTYEEQISGGGVKRHCTSAANIQIHVKVQQVWQIAGTLPLKPLDTVLSSQDPHSSAPQTAVIPMSDLIKKKVLSNCPVGTHYSKTFAQCEY